MAIKPLVQLHLYWRDQEWFNTLEELKKIFFFTTFDSREWNVLFVLVVFW